MRKTIQDPTTREELERRVASLRSDSAPLWGGMDVQRMLCHLCDGLEQALGEREDAYQGNPFLRTIGKWLVIRALPRMPHGAPTSPRMLAGSGGSTPSSFEADRLRLLDLLRRNASRSAAVPFAAHPAFGPLTHEERGILSWKHLDHHLRQFGA